MADITLKNLGDIPVVEPDDSTHLLAEQNGAYARVSKDKVGVTSWHDLQDRPFGEEKVETVAIPEQTVPAAIGTGTDLKYNNAELSETCIVIFDGVRYECEPKPKNTGFMQMYRFGNLHAISASYEDTGEPFGIECGYNLPSGPWIAPKVYANTTEVSEHTVSVVVPEIVTKQLDPKFIPSSEKIAIYIEGLNGEWIVTCDKTAEEVYARVKADPINTEIIGVFKPNMSAGSFDYVEGVVSKPLSVTATENSLQLYFRPLSISGGASLAPADVMVGVMDGEFAVVLLS